MSDISTKTQYADFVVSIKQRILKSQYEDLQQEFIGIKGFSVQNLWNIRSFYLEYSENQKLQTLSREIAWSHNMAIVQKCKENLERAFYIQMTKRYGWTYRVLLNHIENKSYEKFLLNQANFEEIVARPNIFNEKELANSE